MAWETCVKTAVLPQIYRDTAPKNKKKKNNNHSVHLKLYVKEMDLQLAKRFTTQLI